MMCSHNATKTNIEHVGHCCQHKSLTAVQSLEELEFERGVWGAACYGDFEKVRLLLDKGVHPDVRDAAGYTALHYAARNDNLNICKILIEAGADVNSETLVGKDTALHRAVAKGHLDIVKYLIENCADIEKRDGDGNNILQRAKLNNQSLMHTALKDMYNFLED